MTKAVRKEGTKLRALMPFNNDEKPMNTDKLEQFLPLGMAIPPVLILLSTYLS